ncbi:alpha/beta fold hydrolase [Undibacterium sp. SXout7W]|uniref:alpha/beta fold hydrolase n=1 Tax=Undibacterium sp. SXout7W TaxID=3413049 RepID=UPI003BF27170
MASQQFPSKDIFCPPQAFWFGHQDAPVLGWFHAAKVREAGGTRECGVVLCPPFGHEYMVSYLSYKHLANQLAQAGFDVVFFDYNNTGDAADAVTPDNDRIALWQENIQQAADQLRHIAGVSHIALFGLRLGGLLAGSVATTINASALMLMAPVISGRAYSREMLVLRSMSPIQPNPDDPARSVTDDELTGYELSAATRSSLGKLDLLKMPAPTIPVLVMSRDDISGQEAKLANAWHQENPPQPPTLHLSAQPGYAAMMTEDAHETTVPVLIWEECVQWLATHFPIAGAKAASAPDTSRLAVTTTVNKRSGVSEELVSFQGLVGVVSQRVDATQTSGAQVAHLPAVIMTNIGANHRVGNHRLYVTLARTLAAAGFRVLRYDKSGIGYSQTTPAGLEHDVHNECGVDDIRSAMDFLQNRYGTSGFVLAGLCSGAYLSYLSAIDEPQVRGLVLMNQLTYRWHEGDTIEVRKKNSIKSTHFYLQAATDLTTWKRVMTGRIEFRQIASHLSRRVIKHTRARWQSGMTRLMKNYHLLGRVARHFRAMEARGTELLFIFDAHDSSIDLMSEQLGHKASLLGASQRVRIEVLNGTDHTFTPRWAQQHLADLISTHLLERFQTTEEQKNKEN